MNALKLAAAAAEGINITTNGNKENVTTDFKTAPNVTGKAPMKGQPSKKKVNPKERAGEEDTDTDEANQSSMIIGIESISTKKKKKSAEKSVGSGTVKWYNPIKGFGFITMDNEEDIFVGRVGILPAKSLQDGERVQFVIKKTEKGNEAIDVTGPRGAPLKEWEPRNEDRKKDSDKENATKPKPIKNKEKNKKKQKYIKR